MKIKLSHSYSELISIDNLLTAWQDFIRGKKDKSDVQEFGARLFDNIIELHHDLAQFTYEHRGYQRFIISDPKPRIIHKASVRDRVVHHAIYQQLYLFFDRTFIADSFSCRLNKGTHRALNRFRILVGQVSQNQTRTVWVLKCDIKKFFASIDQFVLEQILSEYITDRGILWLLSQVITSFNSVNLGIGLPLGNLTSQLFCNIYLNKFDQFVKHKLKIQYYLRYADDFVVLSDDKSHLENILPVISQFLNQTLKLQLHPDKVFIKTFASGVDFLGWVHFPYYRVLRTTTKRRMFKRVIEQPSNEVVQSYLGLLKYGETYKLCQKIYRILDAPSACLK